MKKSGVEDPEEFSASGQHLYDAMKEKKQTNYASQRIDVFLSQVSDTPRLATALLDELVRHIDRKTRSLRRRIRTFESKWHMSFEEFSDYVHHAGGRQVGKLSKRDVEGDFRAWERTVELLKHYTSLQTR